MNVNSQLKMILETMNHDKEHECLLNIKMSNLRSLINPEFVVIRDCFLIKRDDGVLNEDTISTLLNRFNDQIEVEAGLNEFRINDYFEHELTLEHGLSISLWLIDVWLRKLKEMDEESKFCFILSCDANYVNLRFHKVRKQEGLWISEDLEGFNQPVGYVIK